MLAFWQGGGVFVNYGGLASFDNCGISENMAKYVHILKFELFLHLSSSPPLERYTFSLFLLQGGGVRVEDAEADFTNCTISENRASYVVLAF